MESYLILEFGSVIAVALCFMFYIWFEDNVIIPFRAKYDMRKEKKRLKKEEEILRKRREKAENKIGNRNKK